MSTGGCSKAVPFTSVLQKVTVWRLEGGEDYTPKRGGKAAKADRGHGLGQLSRAIGPSSPGTVSAWEDGSC
jgi:hypothetical protein